MARVAGAGGAGGDRIEEGARLFNERAYYEAHDAFEDEWAASRGPRRTALKALVQVAAGMYHLQTSGYAGAEHLLTSGLALLRDLPDEDHLVALAPVVGPVARCLKKVRALRAGMSVRWEAADLPRLEPLPDLGTDARPRNDNGLR